MCKKEQGFDHNISHLEFFGQSNGWVSLQNHFKVVLYLCKVTHQESAV